MIANDKVLHILAGLIIAAATTCLPWLVSLAAVVLIASTKEFYDLKHPDKHTPEIMDLYATLAGGIVGIIAIRTVIYLCYGVS